MEPRDNSFTEQLIDPLTQESEADIAVREAHEMRERTYQDRLVSVCEKYPTLKEKILSSLETPQFGEYHKEGPTMESHLKLIVSNICDIADGKFHDVLARNSEMQAAFLRVIHGGVPEGSAADEINPELLEYVFFHDIEKQSSLLLKVEGEKSGVEITLDDWRTIAANGEPYMWNGKIVKSISYYHPKEGALGMHGAKGAHVLAGVGLSRVMLTGIAKHEVAYSFTGISAATYEKHFVESGLSEDEQDFVFVASYVDTMSSLRADGAPDMKNYENFLTSRANYLFIRKAIDAGAELRDREVANLMSAKRELTEADIDTLIAERKERESQRSGT